MADKKTKKHYHNITFPKGVARFPKISRPDTKGEYADGKYKTEVVLSDDDTKAMKQQLQKIAAEWFPGVKTVKLPIRTDKKDGTVSFIAKSGMRDDEAKRPVVVDAKRTKINYSKDGVLPVDIGGGSTIKIHVCASNYEKGPNKGINLYLEAVQVITLKNHGDPMAGFSDEEDGYDASEDTAAAENDFADESEDGGSADESAYDL